MGFWKLDSDLQREALGLWQIRHARKSGASSSGGSEAPPVLEDLRLSMTAPVSSGDLAWLWTKIKPNTEADKQAAWRAAYVDPKQRTAELQQRVRGLFVKH